MPEPQQRTGDQQQRAREASERLLEDATPQSRDTVRGSNKKDLTGLSPIEIRQLTNEQVANLPGHVLRLWNSAQFSSLSVNQLLALTRDQLEELTKNHLEDLTQDQLYALCCRNRQASLQIQERLKALALQNPPPSR